MSKADVDAGTYGYRINEVCKRSGLARTTVYQAIRSGALVARKFGRCTVVLASDLDKFLNALPEINRTR